MILSFQKQRSGQTVTNQIRLLWEQSDWGLHCLPLRLHPLDENVAITDTILPLTCRIYGSMYIYRKVYVVPDELIHSTLSLNTSN